MVATIDSPAPSLSVSALAAVVGVRADTVRYYERIGMLPPPPRTAGDHRRYGADAVDRLQFIQGAQRLGLRLREIRELLDVRDTGTCPCGPAEAVLRTRLDEIDAEIDRLAMLRDELRALLSHPPESLCPRPAPLAWLPGCGPPGDAEEVMTVDSCCDEACDTPCVPGCC